MNKLHTALTHEWHSFMPDLPTPFPDSGEADTYEHGNIVTITPVPHSRDLLITAAKPTENEGLQLLRQSDGDRKIHVHGISMGVIFEIFEEAGFKPTNLDTGKLVTSHDYNPQQAQQFMLTTHQLH